MISVCLRLNVSFYWTGPGALLIKRDGVESVVKRAIEAGFVVLGFEAFTIDNEYVIQHLDPIADFTMKGLSADPKWSDPLTRLSTWPANIWVDVSGYLPDSIDFD